MLVSDVLAVKGHRIETIWPMDRADVVPRIFIDRNATSVVVTSLQKRPIGIITDRDVLKALAKSGTGSLGTLSARDIMTSPAPTCAPKDGVVDLLRRMTNERVRHLLVMDQDEMVGLVSIGDLVKHRFQDTEMEMRVLRDLAFAHMST